MPAVVVALSLFVLIIVARASALSRPERFLRLAGPLVVPTAMVLRPVVGLLGALLRRIHPSVVRAMALPVLPLKEKIELYGGGNGDGADEERRIMSSVLEFGETRVREAMVPRIDIVAVNVNMDKDEAIDTVIEAGHSRIPMYEDTIDRVVGVLYTKDLLRRMVDGADFSLRELAREAFFIPESKMIDDLLAEFQARKQHLAVVVDEYGGTAGMITLEDVLEEIVGDIQDEFDTEEALVERLDDDTAVVNAKIRVDELNEALGLALAEEVADSLGGLLYHLFERVPAAGEVLEEPPLRFEVNSVEGQRIEKVRISGLAAAAQESGDGTVTS
jgi:CBS domain containing-hemolysin-like protein